MQNQRPQRIIVVTGPTASGKTALAVKLAEALDGEIINADSVQIYRGFVIGAGAPSQNELARVPHHLFNCLEPQEEWNAGLFRGEARRLISEIQERGRVAVIAGGTGLYIRSLLGGLVEVEVTEEAKSVVEASVCDLRERDFTQPQIAESLHHWLAKLDPKSAEVIRNTDYQRVRRALEVYLSEATSISELQQRHAHSAAEVEAVVYCLLPQRAELYERISIRVDRMLAQGFLNEVAELLGRLPKQSKPLHSIGYRQAVQFLQGGLSRENFVDLMKQETRRFAKRQETWWRHQPAKLGWSIAELPAPLSFDALSRHAQRCLIDPDQLPCGLVRFFRLSGVGFPQELG